MAVAEGAVLVPAPIAHVVASPTVTTAEAAPERAGEAGIGIGIGTETATETVTGIAIVTETVIGTWTSTPPLGLLFQALLRCGVVCQFAVFLCRGWSALCSD